MSYSHLLILLAILVSSLIKICHLHNMSAISKSCFHNICDLRHIRNFIDQTTACTIAISLIHSKIDYCNSLLINLPTQTNRLQLVLNSAAHAVTKTLKFHHITPILKSLHGFKINERIKCKVLSHMNLSKLVILLTSAGFALFFHSLHVVVFSLLFLSPLVALFSPLVLNSK